MFLVRLALRPWRKTFWTQLMAVASLSLLLVLGGFLLGFYQGLKPIVARMDAEQVVTAYLSTDLPREGEAELLDRVRLTLGAAPVQVELTQKEDFLLTLQKSYPELAHEVESLADEANALVPRYVSITGRFPQGEAQLKSLVLELQSVPGIEQVEISLERFTHISAAFRVLLQSSLWFSFGIGFAVLSLFFLVGRMNHTLFAESLQVLQFWGAGPIRLRIPLVLSMAITAALSALVAYVAFRFMVRAGVEEFKLFSPLLAELEIPHIAVANGLVLFVLGASTLLSLVCYGRGKP